MNGEVFIEGTIENIVYTNPENGYSVIDLSYEGSLVTVVGIMPSCCVGEKLKVKGPASVLCRKVQGICFVISQAAP